MQRAVLTIGNPLLDIAVNASEALLQKYGIKLNSAVLASEETLPLYQEIRDYPDVYFIAGGSAQNTARAIQWILKTPGIVVYIGCIGKDENGKTLRSVATSAGVDVQYLEVDTQPTGTCAVLVKDKERALIANLAAANCYSTDHLLSEPIQEIVKNVKIIYGTGFFLTVSPDSLVHLGQHAKQTDKPFLFNISAEFLVNFFWEPMQRVIPYCDYIFCNDAEAFAYGAKQGWEHDLRIIAKKLSESPKENTSRSRTVIFTQGSNPTIVCHGGSIIQYSPIPIPNEEIVDTNGAGDCFVGGFIAGLLMGKDIIECLRAGSYIAHKVIQRSGVTLPTTCEFRWKD